MSWEEVAQGILMYISSTLHIYSIPNDNNWIVTKSWLNIDNNVLVFSASSTEIVNLCRKEPNSYLELPLVVHGAHRILLDNREISTFGDPTFKLASPFYHVPQIRCSVIAAGSNLTWTAWSYSKYFARFNNFPRIVSGPTFRFLANESFNIIAGGLLPVLALFSFVIFYGRISHGVSISICVGILLMSLYFVANSAPYFGLKRSMLFSHKLADFGMWVGAAIFLNGFRADKLLPKQFFYAIAISAAIGCAVIILGKGPDSVQLGTMIPFIPTFVGLLVILFRTLKTHTEVKTELRVGLRVLSVTLFVLTPLNDFGVVSGLINGPVLFSIGLPLAVLSIAFALSLEIKKTYIERDHLLVSLEAKVKSKTEHLEKALSDLKTAQAELIQSAKLASLGTLSAGIAHEINNAINFISGALPSLHKIIVTSIPEAKRDLAERLLKAVQDGAKLTVEIVQSFRQFTGLNQSKIKDVKPYEVLNNTFILLRARITDNILIINKIPENLSFEASPVGINQIFLNLISNAIDAIGKSGNIIVEAEDYDDKIKITFEDTGVGITKENLQRIFDPFFTTKDFGKGTGLGLHIVQTEISKHNGSINISSELGKGTIVNLIFPKKLKNVVNQKIGVAA